jgi:GNAT superfamily N-acetyltransferase
LAGQLGYPCEPADVGRRIRKYEAETEEALFVAEKDGRVVGWTSCGIADHFYTPLYAEISGLVVDAAERGAGIGARLIAEVEAWARGKGVEILRLRANAIRTEAHRFYLREGFEKKKTQIVFEKRL